MFKRITALSMAVIMTAAMMFGCAKKDNSKENNQTKETTTVEEITSASKKDVNIAVLKGATAIGMVSLMDSSDKGTASNNYKFEIHGTADEINTKLIKGELDMACVPCNVASVLYNKTEGKIQMAAINTLGVLYIVETGNSINSVSDLKGKTIYATGQNTTPEYTLRHLLSSNGIDPDKDVNIQFKSEASEVAAMLSEADDAIAMLPQPYVTSAMLKNDKVRIALDVTAEWEKTTKDSTVVTGVLVVRKEYAEKNPDVMTAFLKEYSNSIAFASNETDKCAELLEGYDIFKAAVAKKAMPYITTKYIDGDEMVTKTTSYLKALYDQNSKSIGGNMPGDDFFYISK